MMLTAAAPATHGLMACALLHSFDHAALRAILGLDAGEAAAILGHPAVEAAGPAPGRYRLRAEAAAGLLRRLRLRRPREEYPLHTRALAFQLGLLRGPDVERAPLLAASLHHLRAIHDLNLHYMRWSELESFISELAIAAPDIPAADRHQIALYEAYLAQRRQQYERCEQLVAGLLAAPALPGALQADALIVRGLSAWGQARIEAALADFVAAHAAAEAAGSHAAAARALVNQGWLHNQLFQFAEAIALSRRGLAAYDQAGDRYGAAYAHYSIGNNALYLGDWELGRRCLDRAAATFRAAAMVARLATVDWGRGFLHQMLGNHERSKRAYLRALRTAESAEHGNAVTAADTLFELGLVYQLQGRRALAEETLRRAAALAERLGDELNHALLLHRYSRLLDAAHPAAALAELASAIEKLERLRFSTRSEEVKISLLGTAQQVYETMVLSQVARGDIVAAFDYVEQARARAFLDLLAGRGELDELPQAARPASLAEVQARLAPGALLLEFFTVGLLPDGGGFLAHIPPANQRLRELLLSEPQILLFAVTAGSVELHRLPCDPNLLQPPPGDPAPGWHLMTERKLRWLYTQLMTPVAPLVAACQVLHIVPHGPLHYLPFAALRAADGRTLLHAGGPAIAYAPSASVLIRSLDEAPPDGGAALALGYDDRGAAALLMAEREAEQLGRLAGGAALTGPAEKFGALQERAAGLRWLHIAGHAVYRADDPLASSLGLGAGESVSARAIMGSLSLRGALVTLNACTSGLSHVSSGDELLGLPRAFLYAGAATIVCTLYEIDDLAAYTLMAFFAEDLGRGASPAAALHAAQLRLRDCDRATVEALLAAAFSDAERAALRPLDGYEDQPFAHPRYWAPFLLVGRP